MELKMASIYKMLKLLLLLFFILVISSSLARSQETSHQRNVDRNYRPPTIDTRQSHLHKNIMRSSPHHHNHRSHHSHTKKHARSIPKQQEEPSFMSRIASWIFPFGNSGNEEKPTQRIYSPSQQNEEDCNPCNQEPWIPVSSKTVIGFIPPPQFNHPGSYVAPPTQYGVPSQNRPISSNYGAPVETQYGPPKLINEYGPPKNEYGPPKNEYGPPKQFYGPPKPIYRPPNTEYGPPRNLQSVHTQHPTTHNFGSINGFSQFKPNEYKGSPLPHLIPPSNFNTPPKNYGQHFGPPKQQFGVPNHQYRQPINNADSHLKVPGQGYKTIPSFESTFKYGPPSQQPLLPAKSHGPPIPLHNQEFSNINIPNNEYGVPTIGFSETKIIGISEGLNIPSPTQNIPPKIVTPTSEEYNPPLQLPELPLSNVPQDNQNLDFPQPIPFPNLHHYPLPPLHNAQQFFSSDQTGPVDSYGTPLQHNSETVVHDSLIKDVISSLSDSGTVHSHHDTSLSASAVQPSISSGNYVPNQPVDVQLVKSIPLAEFTSSIEYPASIVQSPLVDVIATHKEEENGDSHDLEQHFTGLSYNNENSKDHGKDIDNSKSESNLYNNPIVVDHPHDYEDFSKPADTDSAASSHNLTVHVNNHYDDDDHTGHDFDNLRNHNLDNREVKDGNFGTHTIVEIQPSVQTAVQKNLFGLGTLDTIQQQINQGFEKIYANHNYESVEDSKQENSGFTHLYLKQSPPQKNAKEFNFVTPINDNKLKSISDVFTPPSLDYSSWIPSPGPISTSMSPPAKNAGGEWISNIENTYTFKEEVPEGMKPPPLPLPDVETSTAKTKQIQIIIPYTSNSRPMPFQDPTNIFQHNSWYEEQQSYLNNGQTPQSSNESPVYWMTQYQNDYYNQEESKQVTATEKPLPNTTVSFDSEVKDKNVNVLDNDEAPFDILRLQQNIDEWTESEYTKTEDSKKSTPIHLIPSKKIPQEYLTTTELYNDVSLNELTTNDPVHRDFIISINNNHEYDDDNSLNLIDADIHNLTDISKTNSTLFYPIIPEHQTMEVETTTETVLPETTETITVQEEEKTTSYEVPQKGKTMKVREMTTKKPVWEKIQIDISPHTNETVYVVTPIPWHDDEATPSSVWSYTPKYSTPNKLLDLSADDLLFNSPRFTIRPTPGMSNKDGKIGEKKKNSLKIIYSEWPQSINNLETTTPVLKPSSKSGSLWGLMDLSAYTPSAQGLVETIAGHSKVVTVTHSSVPKKKVTNIEEKKIPTKLTTKEGSISTR